MLSSSRVLLFPLLVSLLSWMLLTTYTSASSILSDPSEVSAMALSTNRSFVVPAIPSKCLKLYGPFGGTGGGSWSDSNQVCNVNFPTQISFWSGKYINAIKVTYSPNSATSGTHGSPSGTEEDFGLSPNEYITNIFIRGGQYIDYIAISTNLNRGANVGNPTGGSIVFNQNFTDGEVIAWFYGSSGTELDALGFETVSLTSQAEQSGQ